MPFKFDANGLIVLADHEGKKLPVFINDKGEEAPFDADGTVATIARLNGESKTHRQAKEALEARIKVIPESILKDPTAAEKALTTVANLDAKRLVDAGEIERVKAEIGTAWQGKLTESETKVKALSDELYAEKVGGAFVRSDFIKAKIQVPADFVQARFESHFGIEGGKIFAVDSNGQKIYSSTNPGELAGFDEALTKLVMAHPQKDSFLKGSGASGGGAQGGGGGAGGGGGQGGQQAGNLGGTRVERSAAIAARFPELTGAANP